MRNSKSIESLVFEICSFAYMNGNIGKANFSLNDISFLVSQSSNIVDICAKLGVSIELDTHETKYDHSTLNFKETDGGTTVHLEKYNELKLVNQKELSYSEKFELSGKYNIQAYKGILSLSTLKRIFFYFKTENVKRLSFLGNTISFVLILILLVLSLTVIRLNIDSFYLMNDDSLLIFSSGLLTLCSISLISILIYYKNRKIQIYQRFWIYIFPSIFTTIISCYFVKLIDSSLAVLSLLTIAQYIILFLFQIFSKYRITFEERLIFKMLPCLIIMINAYSYLISSFKLFYISSISAGSLIMVLTLYYFSYFVFMLPMYVYSQYAFIALNKQLLIEKAYLKEYERITSFKVITKYTDNEEIELINEDFYHHFIFSDETVKLKFISSLNGENNEEFQVLINHRIRTEGIDLSSQILDFSRINQELYMNSEFLSLKKFFVQNDYNLKDVLYLLKFTSCKNRKIRNKNKLYWGDLTNKQKKEVCFMLQLIKNPLLLIVNSDDIDISFLNTVEDVITRNLSRVVYTEKLPATFIHYSEREGANKNEL